MTIFVHCSLLHLGYLNGRGGDEVIGEWITCLANTRLLSCLGPASPPRDLSGLPGPPPSLLQGASTSGWQREPRARRCAQRPPPPTPPRGVPRVPPNRLFSLVFLCPSLVKPLRHYAVFLSEDSSDDECQRQEGPSSGFTESFFFSAPFEWSLLSSSISLSSTG